MIKRFRAFNFNKMLRVALAALGICLTGSAANYYFDLGWFGPHAKLVNATILFVTMVSLVVAIRLWRDESTDSGEP
jgi:hypothetical protein